MTLHTPRRVALGLAVFVLVSVALGLALSAQFGGPGIRTQAPRTFVTVLADAQGLPSRADVLVHGVRVGEVARVAPAGARTRVALALDPGEAPVLRRGARVRVGTKTPLGEPFVDLDPGRGTPLREGATLPARGSVEVDEALSVLDPGARRDLTRLLRTAARGARSPAAAQRVSATLAQLERATAALGATGETLRGQEPQLAALVRDAGTVLRTTAEEDAAVRELVAGTRDTLRATASRRPALAAALAELPRTLTQARTTLRDARPLVAEATPLVADLEAAAPALTLALRALPPALGDTATVLRRAPTLRSAAAPALRALDAAVPGGIRAAERLSPALANLVPMARYVDQHRTTAAAWFSNTAALGQNGDAKGRWARFFVGFDPSTALGMPGGPAGNAYTRANDGTDPQPYRAGDFPRLLPYPRALQSAG